MKSKALEGMTADKTQAEPERSVVSGKSGKSTFSVHAEKFLE